MRIRALSLPIPIAIAACVSRQASVPTARPKAKPSITPTRDGKPTPTSSPTPPPAPRTLTVRAPDHLVVAALDSDGELLVAPTFAKATSIAGTAIAPGLHLIKIQRDGRVRWDLTLATHGEAYALAMQTGRDGDIYLAGSFARQLSSGDQTLASNGDRDAFVARIGPGGSLQWMDAIGGPAREAAISLSVSEEFQRVAIGGWAESSFTFAKQAFPAHGTAKDGFAAVYAIDGTPQWAKRFRGVGSDRVDAVGLDQDALVVFGSFQNRLELGKTALLSRGEPDLFCARYGGDGGLEWQRSWGSDKREAAAALRIDDDGRLTLAALSEGPLFLTNRELPERGQSDIVLWQLSAQGAPLASLRLGGPGAEVPGPLSRVGPLRLLGQYRGDTNLGFADIHGDSEWHALSIEVDPEFRIARSHRPEFEQAYLTESEGLSLGRTGANTVLRW